MSVSTASSIPASNPTSDPNPAGSRDAPAADYGVLAGLWAVVGLVLTVVVAVHTKAGQTIDTRAMVLTAQTFSETGWPGRLLALISPASVMSAIVVLAFAVWVARGAVQAAAAAATATGTIVGATLLKAMLVRPELLDDSANSLPSGHVAAVAGLAAAVVLATAPAIRPLVAVVSLGAVGVTGLATMALGWHRPSDVLAAGLLAIGMAAAVHSLVVRLAPTRTPRRLWWA